MFIRNIGLKGLCFCFWGEEVFSLSGLEIKVLLVTEWVCKDSLRLSGRKGWIVWEKLVTIFPVVSVTLFWKEQFVSEPLLLLPSLFFVLLLYFSPKSQVVLRMEEVKLALTALYENMWEKGKNTGKMQTNSFWDMWSAFLVCTVLEVPTQVSALKEKEL